MSQNFHSLIRLIHMDNIIHMLWHHYIIILLIDLLSNRPISVITVVESDKEGVGGGDQMTKQPHMIDNLLQKCQQQM